jgi:hypothetical protein
MPIAQPSAKFDSPKPVAKTNDGLQEYIHFDCDALDHDIDTAEDAITIGDAASSLIKILYWTAVSLARSSWCNRRSVSRLMAGLA